MNSALRLVLIILSWSVLLSSSFAQAADTVPQAMVLQGKLVDSGNAPVEAANVTLTLQVRSPGSEDCLLFEETHSLDLTGSGGVFSVSLGSGHRTNPSTAFKDTSTLAQAFDNWSGAVGSLTCASGSSYSPVAKDKRKLKIIFDDGTAAGPQTFADSMELNSVPFAFHADSLRGKTPSDFAQVIDTNTQSRFADAFSTRYSELNALLSGTSTQYTKADGTNFSPSSNVDFNSQRLTNIATPTSGTDAATKNYCDATIGGKSVSGLAALAAPDAGKILIWNGTTWVAQTASTTDSTKLPLAGGTMAGAITMANNNITSAGHITQSSNHYLQLGAFDDTAEGTLVSGTLTGGGVAYKGVTWFNSTSNTLKYWNGSSSVAVANMTGTLAVANGGTGATSLAAGNILIGGGTGAVTSLASGGAGNIVYGSGLSSWASGSPDTAGLLDKTSIQTISGAKAFSTNITLNAQNDVRFADADSSNYVGLRAPATVSSSHVYTLPAAIGSSGQALTTDSSGNLSWASITSSQWTTNGSDIHYDTGKVGIGTSTPASKLDVQGEVRIASSGDGCSSTNEGAQRYNSSSKIMEFCNGTAWTSFTAAVPVIPSGAVMAFNLASCPSGWSALDGTGGRLDLRGRTVIGAGTGSGLTARSLGETGGDEKTDVSGVGINVDVWGLTTQTTGALGNPADTTGNTIGKVGLGTAAFYPYNSANQIRFPSSVSITSSGTAGGSAGNMQPFVALLYCQKD